MDQFKKITFAVLGIFLIFGFAAITYLKTVKNKSYISNVDSNVNAVTNADTIQQKNLLNVVQTKFNRPGLKMSRYENFTYGFGFDYPDDKQFNLCAANHCGVIEDLNIHFRTLSYDLLTPRGAALSSQLLNLYLYCDADGAGGSMWCDPEKTQVETLALSNGTKIYKIFRAKHIEQYLADGSKSRKDFSDVAYVIPFPERINGDDAIYFYADEPTDVTVAILNRIVGSFYFKPTW